MKVSLIVACTIDGGIAYNNTIPWHIPEDLKKFKNITTKCQDPHKINAVIMGRHTWESINGKLPNRLNIVITSNEKYHIDDTNVIVVHSITSALAYCDRYYVENTFIIGGTHLYNIFLNQMYHRVDKIYMSLMFCDEKHITNKYIDIDSIFTKFKLYKDLDYSKESDKRLFASYICLPLSDLDS